MDASGSWVGVNLSEPVCEAHSLFSETMAGTLFVNVFE